MDRRAFLTTLAGAGLATVLPTAADAATWVHLGTRKVNGVLDVDSIGVGAGWGTFRKVRLKVRGNDLFLYRFVVRFENGGSQEMQVANFIPQGGYTRTLDLKGGERFIRRVNFFYGKIPNGQGSTWVDVYGRR
jgi:hypothetical protein